MAVTPAGASIGIEQIREAMSWARYAPYRARRRVILIGPADKLSHEAASALLKSLEEAPSYLAFILFSRAPDQLIPTVRSRCAILWAPGGRKAWAAKLREAGYTEREAKFILPFLSSEEDVNWFLKGRVAPEGEWDAAREEMAGLPPEELAIRFLACSQDPFRRRAAVRALADSLADAPADRVLAAADRLAGGERGRIVLFLRELVAYLNAGGPSWLPPEHRIAWARKASLARGEMEANVNVKLLVEVILLWPKRG